jgi:hypothetical protein
VAGLTHGEFRAILETGFRIIEVWESQEGFEEVPGLIGQLPGGPNT